MSTHTTASFATALQRQGQDTTSRCSAGGITFHSASARRTLPSPWGWLYVVQSSIPNSSSSDGVTGVLWQRAAGAEQMRRVG